MLFGQLDNVIVGFDTQSPSAKTALLPQVAIRENGTTITTTSGSAFASEGFSDGVVQGITFQSTDANATTVDIENYYDLDIFASVGPNTAHVALHDVNTIGGKQGLGLCLDSSTQCDTIMTVGGTFRDAEIGWARRRGGFGYVSVRHTRAAARIWQTRHRAKKSNSHIPA